MARAKKLCSHVGPDGSCSNLMPCEDHAPKPWESSNRRSELPSGWSHRIVPRILRRDPICTDGIACGDENGRPMALSTEVHHTARPDQHGDEFLAGTCSACHRVRTGQQAAEGRRLLRN